MGRFAHVVRLCRSFPPRTVDRRPRAIEPLEPRALLAASLLDPSFGGGDGIASVDFRGGGEDTTADVAVLPGGKILVAATARRRNADDTSSDFALARFNADGSLDTAFGAGGKVTTDFHNLADVATAMAVLPDGKVVIVGCATRPGGESAERNIAVARYNADGSPDRTFDGDGKAVLDVGDTDVATDVAILPDGDIVVAGHTSEGSYYSNADMVAVRYNPDGTRDRAFGGTGVVRTDFDLGGSDLAHAVAALPGGKILLAGVANGDFALARLNADGSPDKTLDADGLMTDDIGATDAIYDASVQPDGDVLVSGDTRYYGYGYYSDPDYQRMVVARYDADGTRDGDFGYTTGPEDATQGTALLVLPSGKILVADAESGGVARLNADGSPDPTFDGEDGFYGDFRAIALALQGNSPIVGGTTFDGTLDAAVVRLKVFDTLDDTDDQTSEAPSVGLGVARTADIETPTDVDLYKLTVRESGWLSVDLDLPAGSALDPVIRLFSPGAGDLGSNDDAPAPGEPAGTRESYLRVFVSAGTVYVGVSGSPNASYSPTTGIGDIPGSTGRYTFTATFATPPADPDDQINEAVSLSVGSSKSGSINPDTDVDLYKFAAGAGQVIAFDVDLSVTSGLFSLLRVFDADGQPLNPLLSRETAPGEVYDGREFYAEYRFENAGTYYVGVSATGNSGYNPVTGKDDSPSATGDYTLRLSAIPADADDQISEAARLTVGGPAVTGRVSSYGDVDLFSFTAVAGRPIAIDLDRTGSGAWYSALTLFNDVGEPIAGSFGFTAPGEAPSPDAYLEFLPTSAGRYYLGVSSADNRSYDPRTGGGDNRGSGYKGNYSVTLSYLATDSDDQLTEAKTIRVGSSASGSIDPATDVDLYRIDVRAGQWLRFDIDHVSGALDSALRLILPDGGTHLSVDNANAPGETASNPTEACFDHFFADAGTYYVGVSDTRNADYDAAGGFYDRAGATGKYKLIVTEIAPPRDTDDQFGEARTLGTASTARDTIGDRDVDMYTFKVAKDSTVDVRVAALDAVFLRVYNAAREPVSESFGSIRGIQLAAGTYYVAVSAEENTGYDPVTGNGDFPGTETRYELALSVTPVVEPPPPSPGPRDSDDQFTEARAVSIGSAVTGRIDPAGDVDMVRLSLPAGKEFLVRLDAPTLPVVLRLFDSANEEVSRNGDSFVLFSEDGGTYYLGVSAAENADYDPAAGTGDNTASAKGDYTLAVQLFPDDADDQVAEAAALGVNTSRSGTLSGDFDVDVYAIKVTAGQRVAFDIDIPASNTVGDTVLRLFGADGVVLADNDDAAAPGEEEGGESYLEYVFQVAGTYYVAVSGSGNGGYDVNSGRGDSVAPGGAYTLRVSSPPTSG